MTEAERRLLKDTAETLLRLLRQWEKTIDGMRVAISELYRADMTTPERKVLMIERLKIRRDLVRQASKPTAYLDDLIDDLGKWSGR